MKTKLYVKVKDLKRGDMIYIGEERLVLVLDNIFSSENEISYITYYIIQYKKIIAYDIDSMSLFKFIDCKL